MAPAPASAGSPRAVAGTPPSSAGRGGGSRGRRGGAPGGASRPRGAAPSSASPPRAHARGPGRGAGERRGAGEGPGASQGGHAVPLSRGGRAGPGGRRRAPVAAVTRLRARVPFPLPRAVGGGRRARGRRRGPCALPFSPGGSGRPAGPAALGLFLVSSRIDVVLRARVGPGGLSRQMDPLSDVCIFFPDESSWLVEVMCVMSVCFCLLFHRHNTSAHF